MLMFPRVSTAGASVYRALTQQGLTLIREFGLQAQACHVIRDIFTKKFGIAEPNMPDARPDCDFEGLGIPVSWMATLFD